MKQISLEQLLACSAGAVYLFEPHFVPHKDGPLVNLGCDFGLMPSEFEPGGIVQHEFFIAETPVIANKTGGLQDTVIVRSQISLSKLLFRVRSQAFIPILIFSHSQ